MLTSTARLKQPIGIMGLHILGRLDDLTVEYGVRLFSAAGELWQFTDGPWAGAVIHADLLNFDL